MMVENLNFITRLSCSNILFRKLSNMVPQRQTSEMNSRNFVQKLTWRGLDVFDVVLAGKLLPHTTLYLSVPATLVLTPNMFLTHFIQRHLT